MAEQLNQISSLRTPDAEASRATRPRRFKFLHVPLIVVVTLLVCYGLAVVYSAVSTSTEYTFSRQLMGVAAGIVAMVVLWRVDYRVVSNMTMPLFVVSLLLILSPLVPGLGTDAGMGARCWINVGIQVQPGEFAKVTDYHARRERARALWRQAGRPARVPAAPSATSSRPFVAILTAARPGHGPCVPVHRRGGARRGRRAPEVPAHHAGRLRIAAVALVFAVDESVRREVTGSQEYLILKQYQRDRLLVFMNQDSLSSDEGWNLQQAMIAIGSGGLFGKGLDERDAKLARLPAGGADRLHLLRGG